MSVVQVLKNRFLFELRKLKNKKFLLYFASTVLLFFYDDLDMKLNKILSSLVFAEFTMESLRLTDRKFIQHSIINYRNVNYNLILHIFVINLSLFLLDAATYGATHIFFIVNCSIVGFICFFKKYYFMILLLPVNAIGVFYQNINFILTPFLFYILSVFATRESIKH